MLSNSFRRITIPEDEPEFSSTENICDSSNFRGKPSFLRFIARKCSYLSRTCREMVENKASSSIVSYTKPQTLRDKKYDDVFESLFHENIHKPINPDSLIQPKNPRELLDIQFELDDPDIQLMDRYKRTPPFLVVSNETTCIVCGKKLCLNEPYLAPFGCKGCTQRLYCSSVCFGMDWPFHARYCLSGQADFLIQFLLNRLRCKCNLNLQLQNVANHAACALGRGAIVIMFENLESLKVFIKHNQDFSLEYYYSLQYMSISMIQDKLFWLDSFNLFITMIKSYDICTQFAVVLLVKSNVSAVFEWDGSQPFGDISIINYYQTKAQVEYQIKNDLPDLKLYFEMLINSTKWDFKARRKICLFIIRLMLSNECYKKPNDFISEALNHYYLTGRLKIELIESCLHKQPIKNCQIDWDTSTMTSIV